MKALALAIIISTTFLAACSPQSSQPAVEQDAINQVDSSSMPVTASPDTQTSQSEVMMEGDVRVIEVEAGSFYFNPNEIRVKKGEKVRITLKSVSMMHNFVIDELGVEVPVTPDGETGTVEFVADTAGTFEYYCSVGNHRAQGQVGTLIVE